MSRSALLQAEAEVQRHALKAQLEALRRQPSTALHHLNLNGGGLSSLFVTKVLLKRSPMMFYGWLLYRAWRAFSAARQGPTPVRRSPLRAVTGKTPLRPISRLRSPRE